MWSLHVLPVSMWVLSRYSSFPPQSEHKDLCSRCGADFTWIFCVLESVNGCLSLNVRLVTS